MRRADDGAVGSMSTKSGPAAVAAAATPSWRSAMAWRPARRSQIGVRGAGNSPHTPHVPSWPLPPAHRGGQQAALADPTPRQRPLQLAHGRFDEELAADVDRGMTRRAAGQPLQPAYRLWV